MDQEGNPILSARQNNKEYFEIAKLAALAPEMKKCIEGLLELIEEEKMVISREDPRSHHLVSFQTKFKTLNS